MSFAEYILYCRVVSDTERGDLVEDMQRLIRAGKMPAVKTWRELECFIVGAGGCSHVVAVARAIWADFEIECTRETLLDRL